MLSININFPSLKEKTPKQVNIWEIKIAKFLYFKPYVNEAEPLFLTDFYDFLIFYKILYVTKKNAHPWQNLGFL